MPASIKMYRISICRHFKEKIQQQTKKDETKWRLLVSKVIAVKNALGPFPARSSGSLDNPNSLFTCTAKTASI